MCGLIGCIGKNKGAPEGRAVQYVVEQYEEQFRRGSEGFGIVEIMDDGSTYVYRATEPAKMMADIYRCTGKHIFLHHRSPTSTKNMLSQTHPVEVEHEELKHIWLIMHNGHTHNADVLKEAHEKLGYYYSTSYQEKYTATAAYHEKFLDSEAFAIDLARYLEGITKELEARGGSAFIAIAMDNKWNAQKVYIGQNGYGGLNLADIKHSFAFASEETLGEDIKIDECIQFNAVYAKEKTGDKKSILVGFEKVKDPIELKYKPAPGEIKSPYSGLRDEDDYQDHGHYSMGYGKHQIPKEGAAAPADAPSAKRDGENTDVNISSFGHIITHVMRSEVGKVFRDSKMAAHSAVEQFDQTGFNKEIIAGNVEKAEDIFNKYGMSIVEGDGIDLAAEVLDDCLMPQAIRIPNKPKVSDIIDATLETTRNRMSKIAAQYLPLFRVIAYCECVLTLAYQYKMDLTDPKKKEEQHAADVARAVAESRAKFREKNDAIVSAIDNADPDKMLDEQIERDVAEVFPGPGGRDDERISSTNLLPAGPVIMKEAEYKEIDKTKEETMDDNAELMLQALSETVHETPPEKIYEDAEDVADSIRTAAELAIIKQLGQIQEAAVEAGEHFRIPFHITKIKDELNKVETRFTELANIVKATHLKEDEENTNSFFLSE